MPLPGRLAILVCAALITIGCDQATKAVAVQALGSGTDHSFLADALRLRYVENTGGFLSLGANLPPIARIAVFNVATGFGLVALAVVAIRRRAEAWSAAGLMLLVAGGASNWIDRLLRGSVVDFLNVGLGPVRTGIFNLADVAILAGAALFVFASLGAPRTRPPGVDADRGAPSS